MKLTNRTKEAFWIWYLLPKQKKTYKTHSLIAGNLAVKIRFLAMSPAEQYGVLVDFFDSVEIDVCIERIGNKGFRYLIYYDVPDTINIGEDIIKQSRPQARASAIEKANEIFNQLNK